ncbi:MAG: phosphomannomutase/phosphoglucomutase [Ruminococcaceae bacterium]|nr:phosphomannomutase/phosphoglucomutase [Oscillospiraceae bacterium]
MADEIFAPLKSGTDIRGIAVAGVPDEDVNLTDEVLSAISYGFATWLYENVTPQYGELYTVAIGHDSRISAERIKNAILPPLLDCGINVKDCGLSSTPAMFMTTVDFECDAAIEITASHHPWNKNGLKFFIRKGGLESADISAILSNAQYDIKPELPEDMPKGEVTVESYMNNYAAMLREKICEEVNADDYARPLRGFKIVVDAGNGVGGFYADKVLAPLGADIEGSQFLEPDGMFPNHMPNPENAEAMASISEAVRKNNADLGIIFDTDVDRAACVASDGKEINRNALIALASIIALEGNEGGTIVTDSVTSSGLKDFIEKDLGAKHHRFKRGYKNVINEAKRLNLEECVSCPLAIETSGHAAMRENYFLDDGAYLMTKIIIKAAILAKEGKKLESLIENLVEPLESAEYRIKILDPDFKEYGNKVISDLERYVKENVEYIFATDSFEGIRATKLSADGWFLLRLSVHDPILPLNIETNKAGGVDEILVDLKAFLSKYDKLDVSVLG